MRGSGLGGALFVVEFDTEKALLSHFCVIGKKLMLAILTIWLRLISCQCLELNQNSNSPTHSSGGRAALDVFRGKRVPL